MGSSWYLAGIMLLWAASTVADHHGFASYENFTTFVKTSDGFPRQTFRSSNIIAPVFHINTLEPDAVDNASHIFLGAVYDEWAGPMIFDSKDLSLVYADQRFVNVYTSDVQMINGTRYLTFWEGSHTRGHANGRCLAFDEQYNLVYNVTAQGIPGALADMHELKLTNDGTAIFSTYWNIPYNCSSVNGPEDALLMDSGFQEVNLATNEVIFQWAASDHFAIDSGYAEYSSDYGVGPDSGFDFAHINSIQKTSDGNYLVSSRHLGLVTLIDGRDGHPIWMLGGKSNQFRDLSDGKATDFGWQHDARFYKNQSHITMFDNHVQHTTFCQRQECESRGLHLEIDTTAMTARVVREYYHPQGVNSGAMGGFQTLDNGNVILGWGYNPSFVEYTRDGKVVMSVQRGRLGNQTLNDLFAYRVNKRKWIGRPTWPPSAAIDASNATAMAKSIYLSWNGATEVAKWAVFDSESTTSLNGYASLVTVLERNGFETEIQLGNSPRRYVCAAALSIQGEVLGSTSVMDTITGDPLDSRCEITINSVYPPTRSFSTSHSGAMHNVAFVPAMLLVAVGVIACVCRRQSQWQWM